MLSGGCHCGAVRYTIAGDLIHHTLCHCSDCRRNAGAPVVGWAGARREQFHIDGDLTDYRSSPDATRSFCPTCGTGLFYVNEEVLPGLIDVQTSTFDTPEASAPSAHVQVAERLPWMEKVQELPTFDRYPG